jgi:hypothetical protein
MGTWGTAITSDDTVADVVSFVTEKLKAGESIDAATASAIAEFAELEKEDDEGPFQNKKVFSIW